MNTRPVALVTGAGKRRLGWHVAAALAERGYALAIHYRTSENEAQATIAQFHEQGVEAEAYQADLADEAAVKKMVADILLRFGRIDVLVNSA